MASILIGTMAVTLGIGAAETVRRVMSTPQVTRGRANTHTRKTSETDLGFLGSGQGGAPLGGARHWVKSPEKSPASRRERVSFGDCDGAGHQAHRQGI